MKDKRDIGNELLQSVREMKAGKAGRVHHVAISPVAETRVKAGLSQSAFADLIGISKRTVQEWEQGRRTPSGPAQALLKIVNRHPEVLQDLAA
ncbi:MAG: helix-turn-helix domain-containing protein [Mariprofundaceae bacterium]|nr:helix-turn-helix domain-containing protein [Mariprofundaceae bacterium]